MIPTHWLDLIAVFVANDHWHVLRWRDVVPRSKAGEIAAKVPKKLDVAVLK